MIKEYCSILELLVLSSLRQFGTQPTSSRKNKVALEKSNIFLLRIVDGTWTSSTIQPSESSAQVTKHIVSENTKPFSLFNVDFKKMLKCYIDLESEWIVAISLLTFECEINFIPNKIFLNQKLLTSQVKLALMFEWIEIFVKTCKKPWSSWFWF